MQWISFLQVLGAIRRDLCVVSDCNAVQKSLGFLGPFFSFYSRLGDQRVKKLAYFKQRPKPFSFTEKY